MFKIIIQQKKPSFKIKTGIFICGLFFAFILSSGKSQAALWPGIDPMITSGLIKIYDLIQGSMLSAAKQAAGVAINQQLDALLSVGGADGGPMFIVNWDDYLVDQPKQNADIFINDYISETTSGKGSLSNYQAVSNSAIAMGNYEGVGDGSFAYGSLLNKASAAGSTSSGGGNYMLQLAQGALALTTGQIKSKVTYEGDPSQMFNDGTMKNMSLYLSGINNPWAYNMDIQNKYQEKIANEKDVAKTMSVAYQGVLGAGDKKNIINPGSLIKDLKAGYQNFNIETIVNAESLSEIITGAVSTATARAVSMGIGSVQAQITQKNSALQAKISGQLNSSGAGQFFEFVNRSSGSTVTTGQSTQAAVPWVNPDVQ